MEGLSKKEVVKNAHQINLDLNLDGESLNVVDLSFNESFAEDAVEGVINLDGTSLFALLCLTSLPLPKDMRAPSKY